MIKMSPCEIKCKDCGHQFEGMVVSGGFVYIPPRISPSECPKCHSKNIRRAIHIKNLFNLFG